MSSLPRAFRFLLVLFFLTAGSHIALGEELVVNGGFEAPVLPPGTFQTISGGSEPVGFAWTVFQGDVDLGNGANLFILFNPVQGEQGLDLAGNVTGGITQVFPTDAGTTYRLSFLYADNPVQGGDKTANFVVEDFLSSSLLLQGTVTHGTSVNVLGGANESLFEGTFVASGSATRLSFLNTTPGGGNSSGILLDGISVTAVPEPASMAIALCGAVALLGSRLFRRRAD